MKGKLFFVISLCLVILLISCENKRQVYNELFSGISYNWATSTPEAQGLDSVLIEQVIAQIDARDDVYSFLVIKNGFLVVEEHYNDRDGNTMDAIYSVTKSIISASVGIAIEMGFIDSLDQKLMDFFPEYDDQDLDSLKLDITVRHLLTMQAGFDSEENLIYQMDVAPNMIEGIIKSDLQYDPGTGFLYSTHTSHLLSGIITKITGMNTSNFTQEYLLEPMGVHSYIWAQDQNGIDYGGAGTFFSARDMARFGYLYLQDGFLNGQQIVPTDWIDETTQNHRDYIETWGYIGTVGYGFQWWTGQMGAHPVYLASGAGGQTIMNIPDLDLVIVAVMDGSTDVNGEHSDFVNTIINNYIIPAASP